MSNLHLVTILSPTFPLIISQLAGYVNLTHRQMSVSQTHKNSLKPINKSILSRYQ